MLLFFCAALVMGKTKANLGQFFKGEIEPLNHPSQSMPLHPSQHLHLICLLLLSPCNRSQHNLVSQGSLWSLYSFSKKIYLPSFFSIISLRPGEKPEAHSSSSSLPVDKQSYYYQCVCLFKVFYSQDKLLIQTKPLALIELQPTENFKGL